mmetsp:Transcript_25268/g.66022  ORF Transcript_25268/g.66022 Transcript_25268/m.66022 type:complete len:326 (-) Transcript_25268:260-1237(-)
MEGDAMGFIADDEIRQSPTITAATVRERGPPVPPDSEPHTVKYLGRTVVKNTEENPPDGRTCTTVVQFLRGLSKRKRVTFTGNVAQAQKLVVSAEQGFVECCPTRETATLSSGLRISLLHITTVADIGGDVCIVTGRVQQGGKVSFNAYVMTSESPYAARYLVEQIVQACRYVFVVGRMRRALEEREARIQMEEPSEQHGTSPMGVRGLDPDVATPSLPPSPPPPASAGTVGEGGDDVVVASPDPAEPEPEKPREVTAADRNFYREFRILHEMLADYSRAPGQWIVPALAPVVSPKRHRGTGGPKQDRGDGLWYTCCRNLGKCTC